MSWRAEVVAVVSESGASLSFRGVEVWEVDLLKYESVVDADGFEMLSARTMATLRQPQTEQYLTALSAPDGGEQLSLEEAENSGARGKAQMFLVETPFGQDEDTQPQEGGNFHLKTARGLYVGERGDCIRFEPGKPLPLFTFQKQAKAKGEAFEYDRMGRIAGGRTPSRL